MHSLQRVDRMHLKEWHTSLHDVMLNALECCRPKICHRIVYNTLHTRSVQWDKWIVHEKYEIRLKWEIIFRMLCGMQKFPCTFIYSGNSMLMALPFQVNRLFMKLVPSNELNSLHSIANSCYSTAHNVEERQEEEEEEKWEKGISSAKGFWKLKNITYRQFGSSFDKNTQCERVIEQEAIKQLGEIMPSVLKMLLFCRFDWQLLAYIGIFKKPCYRNSHEIIVSTSKHF